MLRLSSVLVLGACIFPSISYAQRDLAALTFIGLERSAEKNSLPMKMICSSRWAVMMNKVKTRFAWVIAWA